MFKFRSGINGLNEELGVNTMIGSVNYVVFGSQTVAGVGRLTRVYRPGSRTLGPLALL